MTCGCCIPATRHSLRRFIAMRPETTSRFAIALLATIVLTGLAGVASAGVVISEFRTRGPAGGNDEFVEIWNNSASSVNIGGWTLRGSNSAGTNSIRATVAAGTTLGPGCYFLFVNTATSGYSGATPGNQNYTTGITDDGGLAIADAGAVIVDQVGMSAGSAYKEGTTLAPTVTSINQSYERKPGGGSGNSLDTDNNANDFLYNNGSSNPQNANTCLTATPTRAETWGKVKSYYR
jgi:hypothetical protein